MSPKIGKFKKLRIFSGVYSGVTRSVTPKFYFTFRCLIHRTTIYLKIKKNTKFAFHTPTSLISVSTLEIVTDEIKHAAHINVFVNFSVINILMSLSFFLTSNAFFLSRYERKRTIIGRGLLSSSFFFPRRCVYIVLH